VHIDAPENVEVYLDGNYVGISPCSFKKTSGSHVITLRKSGYETRSYTVQVDEEEKDVSYSFVDLTQLFIDRMILSGRGRNAVNMRKNLDKRDKNRYIYV